VTFTLNPLPELSPRALSLPPLVIFTTRVETIYGTVPSSNRFFLLRSIYISSGCTFVALAPEHPTVQALVQARSLPNNTIDAIVALLRIAPAMRSSTNVSSTPKDFVPDVLLPLQAVHPLTGTLLPVFCAAYVRAHSSPATLCWLLFTNM
jgi:leucyl-tRNA synthetase